MRVPIPKKVTAGRCGSRGRSFTTVTQSLLRTILVAGLGLTAGNALAGVGSWTFDEAARFLFFRLGRLAFDLLLVFRAGNVQFIRSFHNA